MYYSTMTIFVNYAYLIIRDGCKAVARVESLLSRCHLLVFVAGGCVKARRDAEVALVLPMGRARASLEERLDILISKKIVDETCEAPPTSYAAPAKSKLKALEKSTESS